MSLERTCSKDLVTISLDATVLEAAKLMQSKSIDSLVVVEDSRPIGVVTDKDIVRKIVASEKKPAEIAVERIMTSNPRMINVAYDVLDGVRLMHDMANLKTKDIRQWSIECPFTSTLADTYIRPLDVPLGRLIEINSCSLWRERAYCGQECIGNT
jgi:CBS domain-containing protein